MAFSRVGTAMMTGLGAYGGAQYHEEIKALTGMDGSSVPSLFVERLLDRIAKNNTTDNKSNAELEETLNRIDQKLEQQNTQSNKHEIIYVGGSSSSLTSTLLSPTVLIPLAGVSAASYTYLVWYKGYRLSDLYFASQKSLAEATNTLKDKIGKVTKLVNKVSKGLQEQIEKVKDSLSEELSTAKEELSTELHEKTGELSNQLTKVNENQAFGNRGIYLLCKVLLNSIAGGRSNNQVTNSHLRIADHNRALSVASPGSVNALKELHEFTKEHEYVVLNGSQTNKKIVENEMCSGSPNQQGKKRRGKRKLSIDSPASWLGHIKASSTIQAATNSPILLVSPKRD